MGGRRRVLPRQAALLLNASDVPAFAAWLEALGGPFLATLMQQRCLNVANAALAADALQRVGPAPAVIAVMDDRAHWASGVEKTELVDVRSLPDPGATKAALAKEVFPWATTPSLVAELLQGQVIPPAFAAYCAMARPRPPILLCGRRGMRFATSCRARQTIGCSAPFGTR